MRPAQDRRLRVAVNLLWLVPGVVGGTEGYATGLLREVVRRGDVDLVMFVLPEFAAAHADLARSARTVTAPLPPGRRVLRRVGLETTWLPVQLRRWAPDVVHHLGGTALCTGGAPVVLTVHDLQYQHFPQYFSAAKLAYLRAVTRASVRRARRVTTVSGWSRADLISRLDLPADLVTVVPPWLPPAPPLTPARDPALPARYVLYPAGTYPHKNHRVLVEALTRLRGDLADVHLVLTGASGAGAWGSAGDVTAELRSAVQAAGLQDRVHLLGWLPRERYARVLAGATALVFPSRFEGFGLPVAEAMAAGVPVLAADATSLPEVVGRGEDAGGLLLPPDDVGAWATALRSVVTDEAARARLRDRASRRYTGLRQVDPVEVLGRVWSEAAA